MCKRQIGSPSGTVEASRLETLKFASRLRLRWGVDGRVRGNEGNFHHLRVIVREVLRCSRERFSDFRDW